MSFTSSNPHSATTTPINVAALAAFIRRAEALADEVDAPKIEGDDGTTEYDPDHLDKDRMEAAAALSVFRMTTRLLTQKAADATRGEATEADVWAITRRWTDARDALQRAHERAVSAEAKVAPQIRHLHDDFHAAVA